jgi:hypothetical protein
MTRYSISTKKQKRFDEGQGRLTVTTRLEAQQFNERIRTIVAVLSNGGLALFGASAAVLYNGNGTDEILAMAIAGLVLISGSFAASVLLREEM